MNRTTISCLVLALVCATSHAATNVATRPIAVKIEKPGLPNFYRLSDCLYRSAQPTEAGFAELKRVGIKTVINLRAFHSDKRLMAGLGIKQEQIHFNTWHPEEEDIVRFLKLVTNTNTAPVLVHCQHGADRTGTMIAIYRMAIEGWSKEDALKEMTGDQFGFHKMWGNLIRYINSLDIDALKKKAGIVPASAKKLF